MTFVCGEKTLRVYAKIWICALWGGAFFFGGVKGNLLWALEGKSAPTCICHKGFRDIAKKILPAVVDISGVVTQEVGESVESATIPGSSMSLPSGENVQRRGQRRSLGSGFLVDGAGYIISNGHVVHDTESLTVSLADGTSYPAKVLGVDERTDLALLKIETPVSLPTLAWGDSHQAQVGDWVLVAGSPYGFGRSLSAGIISARGRDISQMSGDGGPDGLFVGYVDDLIQTDAAINLGNSGGPMTDHHGDVIGVNVAIYSPSGGSVGIGFAVPSRVAQRVYKALRDQGRVDYGWIGVKVQEVDGFIATSLGCKDYYKKGIRGALVSGVDGSGSAVRAGIAPKDVILFFGPHKIESYDRLTRIVGETKPGTTASLKVWRDGKLLEKSVGVEAWSLEKGDKKNKGVPIEPSQIPYSSETPGIFKESLLNLSLLPLTSSLMGALGLPLESKGLYVVGDEAAGASMPMTQGGIREADVILEINNVLIESPQQMEGLLKKCLSENKRALLFKIWRQGQVHYIGVSLNQDKGSQKGSPLCRGTGLGSH